MVSGMTAIEAKGRDGQVTFDGQWLTITRSGFVGAVLRGGRGDIRLHIGQITGIELKKPGITNGQFTVIAPGTQQSRRGARNHTQNPLSVLVTPKHMEEFRQLRAAVEQAIADRAAPQPVGQTGPSIPEQIAHLAHLRDQGVLSEDEFAAAKARLIGG